MEIRECKLRVKWTKAHVGTSGYELADKLAKEALVKKEIPISYIRVAKSAIKIDLKEIRMET
jgi:ribonuclease HI